MRVCGMLKPIDSLNKPSRTYDDLQEDFAMSSSKYYVSSHKRGNNLVLAFSSWVIKLFSFFIQFFSTFNIIIQ